MKLSIIILFFLLIVASCDKEDANSQNNNSGDNYVLTLDYENRDYGFDEPLEVSLKVATKNTINNQFILSVGCYGGLSTMTVDGEALRSEEKRNIFYENISAPGSSCVLHFNITPAPSSQSEQLLTLQFCISRTDGSHTEKKKMSINRTNNAEIKTNLYWNNAPIEIEVPFEVSFFATKSNFSGEFEVTPDVLLGDGFFIFNEQQYVEGSTFKIPAGEKTPLLYQALTWGTQKLSFTITDKVSSTTVDAKTKVYPRGELPLTENGIYIYAEGHYFTANQWRDELELKPEGIAILSDKSRFLISSKQVRGFWRNSTENFLSAAKLPITKDYYAAVNDFSGEQNTLLLIAASEAGLLTSPGIYKTCYEYDINNPGKWYVPSFGQLKLITGNLTEFNKLMNLIDGDEFEYITITYPLTSSSCADNDTMWGISGVNGSGTYLSQCLSSIICYPVCNL